MNNSYIELLLSELSNKLFIKRKITLLIKYLFFSVTKIMYIICKI